MLYWRRIYAETVSLAYDIDRAICQMEICRETYGVCNWPKVPEACWHQAIAELF